jgi:hypothetical protein
MIQATMTSNSSVGAILNAIVHIKILIDVPMGAKSSLPPRATPQSL